MTMIYLKNIKILIVVLIVWCSCFAQKSSDSLIVSIDSLFSNTIIPEKYVQSASKYFQLQSEAPASTKLITSDEMDTYGYESLTDLLRTLEGFYINDNRKYERLGIRGFDRPNDFNNRILILLDGHRLNLYDGAPVGNDLGLDIHNFESVEIIKGPGSALYGTNAMFAVVNLITKKNKKLLVPEVKASYKSFDTKSISMNIGGDISEKLNFSLTSSFSDSKGENIFFPEFNSPATNNGISEGLDFESTYGIKGIINCNNLQISGYTAYRKKGHPTASFFSVFNAFSQVIDRTSVFELKYHHKLSYNKFITLNTFYDYYNHLGQYHIAISWFDDIGWMKNKFESIGGSVQFTWDVLPNSRLTSGIEYRHDLRRVYILQTADIDYTNVDSKERNLSLFIQNEYQIAHNLSLYLGIRMDDYFDEGSAISPRAGINYLAGEKHVLKLLYGTAFRKPNVYEKYYEIPTLFERNSSLQPEKISTLELVWEYEVNNNLSTSISLYEYRIKNLIDQKFNSEKGLFGYVNIGVVNTLGMEFSSEYKFTPYSSGYLRYSYQNAKDGNANMITSSPQHLVKAGFNYHEMDFFRMAFEVQFETERLTVYGQNTEPFFYSTLFLSPDYELFGIRCSLLIKNLFNSTIKWPGGFQDTQKSIPQRGRTFSFNITFGMN